MNEQAFWAKTPEVPNELPPTELALTVPKEVSALAVGSDRFVQGATDFVVDSEPSFQIADGIQTQLKAEAKQINEKRLEFTRPIDKLKKKWMDFFSPAIDGRLKAAEIYQTKMRHFQRARDEINRQRQLEAETQLRLEREKLEAEARKREEAAARLKTKQAQEKALNDAALLRQTAAVIPESVALAPSLQSSSSSERDNWKSKVKDGSLRDALLWLADHPEWWCLLGPFKEAELKRFAKQFHNVPTRPTCFEYWNDTIYAAKRR